MSPKEPSVEVFLTVVKGIVAERFQDGARICDQRIANIDAGQMYSRSADPYEYANALADCVADAGRTITMSFETALQNFGVRKPSDKLAQEIRSNSEQIVEAYKDGLKKKLPNFENGFPNDWPSETINAAVSRMEAAVKGKIETLLHGSARKTPSGTKGPVGYGPLLLKYLPLIIAVITLIGSVTREVYWRGKVAAKDRRTAAQIHLRETLSANIDSLVLVTTDEDPQQDSEIQKKRVAVLANRLQQPMSMRADLAGAFDRRTAYLYDSVGMSSAALKAAFDNLYFDPKSDAARPRILETYIHEASNFKSIGAKFQDVLRDGEGH